MEDSRKISLCIPVYNRFELLIECFNKVKDDERISEICLYNDGSSVEISGKIERYFRGNSKVIVFHCPKNQGVHIAKKEAVKMASNDWVILFDSDNVLSQDYIDVIFNIPNWDKNVAFQPSYLAPHFDFRDKEGWEVSKSNLQTILSIANNKIDTWGNAQNFFINKDEYLKVWEEGVNINGNDSLYFFYLWMKANNIMKLVPNLQYFHRIHDNTTKEQAGNYNSDRNAGAKIEQVMGLLRQLK